MASGELALPVADAWKVAVNAINEASENDWQEALNHAAKLMIDKHYCAGSTVNSSKILPNAAEFLMRRIAAWGPFDEAECVAGIMQPPENGE